MNKDNKDKIELSEEDVVNVDYLNSIRNDVGINCVICQNIILNPYSCSSCQNCFCKECYNDWAKKGKKCPYRCENSTIAPNRVMKNVLSVLVFKCKKCGEKIKYLDTVEHYKEKCKALNPKVVLEAKNKEIKNLKEENQRLKTELKAKTDELNALKSGTVHQLEFFKSKHHSHTLIYYPISKDPGFSGVPHTTWYCDVCKGQSYPISVPSYNCVPCDFVLCPSCKRKEQNNA